METSSALVLALPSKNVRDYQLIQADTDDEKLIEMWINKPRRTRSRTGHHLDRSEVHRLLMRLMVYRAQSLSA
jgi:hypothetical protein